ncbi:alpha/beta hydrolase [Ferrimonas sp. YFM]|uniref:alpha/beta hydrolase n=1 Tax=Ferrimonas sp. YFM TaxID=3028878 RepID=UPI0025737E49|nr:alpha/beta hydrolase [Ferrimonas sp. YFM]BDY04375.1 lipoprotein [Ferrimonas sp. YFM]
MRLMLLALLSMSLCGCGHRFFYSPKSADVMRIGPGIENYFLDSLSGNQLHLQLHTPSGAAKALVIHFHGNSGHLDETGEKAVWLVGQGYQVLLFDYSGFGLSSGKATRDVLAQDARSLLEHAVTRPGFRSLPKIILATSMGGAIALDGLSSSGLEQRFDLLVLDSSFDDYLLLAQDVVGTYPGGTLWRSLMPLVVDTDGAPMEQITALSHLPVVVSHCNQDRLIPAQRSIQLYGAVQTRKEFWLMPHCAHARTFTGEHPEHQHRLLLRFNQLTSPTLASPPSQLAGPPVPP